VCVRLRLSTDTITVELLILAEDTGRILDLNSVLRIRRNMARSGGAVVVAAL
jgi:hypothetical protein